MEKKPLHVEPHPKDQDLTDEIVSLARERGLERARSKMEKIQEHVGDEVKLGILIESTPEETRYFLTMKVSF